MMVRVYYCQKCDRIFYLSRASNCKKCDNKLIDIKYEYSRFTLLNEKKRQEIIEKFR